jgi:CheY-like chemotaxis protein
MLRLLAEDGLVAAPARSVDEALQRLRTERFDLIITDVEMGERRGLELRGKAPRTLFVTGDILNPELYRELAGLEVHVLNKPFLRTEFIRAVRRCLARRVA